jgi:vacuolar-type H+-ATPase catalytic subunit A/Vma1
MRIIAMMLYKGVVQDVPVPMTVLHFGFDEIVLGFQFLCKSSMQVDAMRMIVEFNERITERTVRLSHTFSMLPDDTFNYKYTIHIMKYEEDLKPERIENNLTKLLN